MSSILGLIGESVSYSLSPTIHNTSEKHLGIPCDYQIYSMPAPQVKSFISKQWKLGAVGFNVTQPHKKLVADLTGSSKLSSVNTLYRGKSGWRSASTDGRGFVEALKRQGKALDDFDRIVILGAGGAVVSLLEYLSELRFRGMVVVASRSTPSPRDLGNLDHLSPVCIEMRSTTLKKLVSNRKDCLIVQGTSAPLKGDDLSSLVPALENFSGTYFDMVYRHRSALLDFCRDNGLLALDGNPMLIEQARASQFLWWGKAADYELIEAAMR